jgi:hypothetical protein
MLDNPRVLQSPLHFLPRSLFPKKLEDLLSSPPEHENLDPCYICHNDANLK